MKNKLILELLTVLLLFGLWSCSGNQENHQLIEDNIADEQMLSSDRSTQVFFQMPSPMELFMFMWEDGAPFNPNLVNNTDNTPNYVDTKKKAMNLGVYSADLAYCTVYEDNKKTVALFISTKELAESLGLTEGFDQSILQRIDNNIGNSDSLFQISKESYSKTINFLQAQGQLNILPYIIYGGWIEGVYITTQTVKKYQPETDIAIRIADQELLLENLIEFFESLPKSDKIAQSVIADLKAVDVIYKSAFQDEEVMFNPDSYAQLKKQIETLRSQIVE